MALGLLVLRRGYSLLEYVAAMMLCAGIAIFTLVDSKVSRGNIINFTLWCFVSVASAAILP